MAEKTVSDIIVEYLKENDFDGLYNDDCGCPINDLAPCNCEAIMTCIPGYEMECDCETACDPHIGPYKKNSHSRPRLRGDRLLRKT